MVWGLGSFGVTDFLANKCSYTAGNNLLIIYLYSVHVRVTAWCEFSLMQATMPSIKLTLEVIVYMNKVIELTVPRTSKLTDSSLAELWGDLISGV